MQSLAPPPALRGLLCCWASTYLIFFVRHCRHRQKPFPIPFSFKTDNKKNGNNFVSSMSSLNKQIPSPPPQFPLVSLDCKAADEDDFGFRPSIPPSMDVFPLFFLLFLLPQVFCSIKNEEKPKFFPETTKCAVVTGFFFQRLFAKVCCKLVSNIIQINLLYFNQTKG